MQAGRAGGKRERRESPRTAGSLALARGDAATTAGQEVVRRVLTGIASANHLSLAELSQLQPGGDRRRIHDDITCTVVVLPGLGAVG